MSLSQLKKIALGVMPAICVAIYSVLFLYLNNVSEVNISDIIYPLLLSLSFAVIAVGVCSIFTKSLLKAVY